MEEYICDHKAPVLHAVVIPYPTQGHITPHLQLARHLVCMHGFFITFINTTHNHERMMEAQVKAGHDPESNVKINFVGLPDGLAKDDHRLADIDHFLKAVRAMEPVFEVYLRGLMAKFPITCVIRDVAMSCVHAPARSLGLPVIGFATCAAVGVYCYQNIAAFRDRGFIPIPRPVDPAAPTAVDLATGALRPARSDEEAAARARLLTGFSGLAPTMRVEDLPTYLVTDDMSSSSLRFFLDDRNPLIPECDWVLLNTFHGLEGAAVDALWDEMGINVCPIGPLVLKPPAKGPEPSPGGDHELVMASRGSALWAEDAESLRWLDAQPAASVLYVSFGSIATVSLGQAKELAAGLEASGHRFLWAVRPDLAQGRDEDRPRSRDKFLGFFAGFVARTRGRACVVPWASQPAVLAHPATAAFLSHCGWNSTLESITAGVPVLAWPNSADQTTNARYVTEVWGVGLGLECRRPDGLVVRAEVANKVRRIMAPPGGDDREVDAVRRRCKELEVAARRAASKGGSSHRTMAAFLNHLKRAMESRNDKLYDGTLPRVVIRGVPISDTGHKTIPV